MNEVLGQYKRRQLEQMLDHGMVMLHLDPRLPDVVVPEYLKSDPVLRLNIAYGFNLPGLNIGPEGVFAVLSFNRVNYACTLPWDAVFAMTAPDQSHEGMVWLESVPPELAPALTELGAERGALPVGIEHGVAPLGERAQKERSEPEPEPEPPKAPPVFRVHDGGRDDGAPTPPPDPETGPSTRPTLRLVKG